MSSKKLFTYLSVLPPFLYIIYSFIIKDFSLLFDSLYTLFCIGIFFIICKKFRFFKGKLYYFALIFILLSTFVGGALNAYGHIPHWDKILHFISGFLFAVIGKEIYLRLSGNSNNHRLMRFFALFFAIAAAGLWEIYEFAGDTFLGLSAQNNSLSDTMLDMILGSAGALIAISFTAKK